ncbi:MAG: RNA methyltransferase [Pseudanabaenaceae cyanobacterium bins.68]|nr:RNA methyltransferase [Pseudanabaenaceae cyanobacterium bins.68]
MGLRLQTPCLPDFPDCVSSADLFSSLIYAMTPITSSQNPLVKQLRHLGQSSRARSAQGLFLVEGTHGLTEAIATTYPLDLICCTEAWLAKHHQLLEQTQVELQILSTAALKAITTTHTPDGVVAVAKIYPQPLPQIKQLAFALETIQDPGNLGTLIRVAAAVGLDAVIVSHDSVDIYHPKILRATAGQWFRHPPLVSDHLTTTLQQYQSRGLQLVTTLAQANCCYWEYDFRQPTVIVLGNEGQGISAAVRQLSDQSVKIPLAPGVESLNVGVCGAILGYEARRQISLASKQ